MTCKLREIRIGKLRWPAESQLAVKRCPRLGRRATCGVRGAYDRIGATGDIAPEIRPSRSRSATGQRERKGLRLETVVDSIRVKLLLSGFKHVMCTISTTYRRFSSRVTGRANRRLSYQFLLHFRYLCAVAVGYRVGQRQVGENSFFIPFYFLRPPIPVPSRYFRRLTSTASRISYPHPSSCPRSSPYSPTQW